MKGQFNLTGLIGMLALVGISAAAPVAGYVVSLVCIILSFGGERETTGPRLFASGLMFLAIALLSHRFLDGGLCF